MEVLFGSSENPDGVYQYLPDSGDGAILITTRSKDVALGVGGEMVILSEMKVEEATNLLTKTLVDKRLVKDERGVTSLLKQLTYLPLAITQVGAYINRNRVLIAKYVELLTGTEQDVVSLMSREFHVSTRYRGSRNAVATSWPVSFHEIQKSDAAAIKLSLFLSCIKPKAIPQSILPSLTSEEAMVKAIGTLDGYVFLVRRGDTDIFDMHSLVHLATRIWIGRNALMPQAERDAIQHMAAIFPSVSYENWNQWRVYLPHALRLLRGKETVAMEESYDLYFDVGLCMREDGRIKEAVTCFEKCYHWRQDHLPSNDPAKLRPQRELASAYGMNGEIKEAVLLLEEVVKIQEETILKHHLDRLLSLHSPAVVY
ncbi:uncharacterized protein A1O9_05447 [Exophiala aquamarina CBS 119918]|uniref:Uncharacterized protein n=1 Tax=Exophiala aquamarina CBS 119918 TaxID=1182545 RepID=A0A072PPT5_9EURO|nr:uncharacterized protein A1O9_05447 [Exophiala aquamarina CBS 119918]KEF57530.1 hypothetical protein A1O9_05447 [Exophiala aquamarina CBS 119918]